MAREHRSLLLDAGFADPVVEVRALVFTDEAAVPLLDTYNPPDDWLTAQRERAARGRLFVAIPIFLATARRR